MAATLSAAVPAAAAGAAAAANCGAGQLCVLQAIPNSSPRWTVVTPDADCSLAGFGLYWPLAAINNTTSAAVFHERVSIYVDRPAECWGRTTTVPPGGSVDAFDHTARGITTA